MLGYALMTYTLLLECDLLATPKDFSYYVDNHFNILWALCIFFSRRNIHTRAEHAIIKSNYIKATIAMIKKGSERVSS